MSPNDSLETAWRKLKLASAKIEKEVIAVSLSESKEEEDNKEEDLLYLRPKSEEKRKRRSGVDRDPLLLKK